MVDMVKAEESALKSWYLATIMTYLTRALANEIGLDEISMIDLLADKVRKAARDVYCEFSKD